MDVQKCEAILWSVDLGSFSAAADKLGYTASGITKMVNSLEAEMGFPLVARSNKGIVPTDDGCRLIPIFRRIVKESELVTQVSSEIQGLVKGNITIGSYYSIAALWLPKVISVFRSECPGIKINTMEAYNRELISMLENRRIDCCFFAQNPTFQGDWIPIKEDPLMVWLPENHPKADLKAFPIEDLSSEPFISTRPGHDTELDRLLKQEKISPDIRFSTSDAYTTYSMVEQGLGISFNNKLVAQNWQGKVKTMPFDPPRSVILGIAVPSLADASPATKRFIKCAKKVLADV